MKNNGDANKILINKILPLSFVDGPGCRTAVFLQGCNMRCLYCHNPETQNRCFNCGECVAYCPTGALSYDGIRVMYNSEKCQNCDECIKHCDNYASPRTRYYTVTELFDEINHNSMFINGVTFSGGECSLQTASIVNFAKIAGGLHILVDSNMFMAAENLGKLLPAVNGVMADLKCFSKNKHLELTGCDNTIVLTNIIKVAAEKKLQELRTVIIPRINDSTAEITALARFVGSLCGDFRWKFIKFRNFGVRSCLENVLMPADSVMKDIAELAGKISGKKVTVV